MTKVLFSDPIDNGESTSSPGGAGGRCAPAYLPKSSIQDHRRLRGPDDSAPATQVTEALIEAAPRLKIIGRAGVGRRTTSMWLPPLGAES